MLLIANFAVLFVHSPYLLLELLDLLSEHQALLAEVKHLFLQPDDTLVLLDLQVNVTVAVLCQLQLIAKLVHHVLEDLQKVLLLPFLVLLPNLSQKRYVAPSCTTIFCWTSRYIVLISRFRSSMRRISGSKNRDLS